ncbi:MAG: ABC transporter ATP-binding protein [Planctomycetota bacterium]
MIRFEHVDKTFPNGTRAVRDLSLEVADGETLVLLGTSGSGKTTTMKMVNRLIDPTGGRILLDDRDIMEQDPVELRRHIGYAIQHIGLFPHMNVGENIATVPRLVGWTRKQIDERIDQLLEMVGLPHEVRERFPHQLSGGQKQRVGVARSLAADPPVVLMDEPFGALDPITRDQLQDEFLALDVDKTIIFVTHDIFEAVKMGDRIALLDEGEVQQLAAPAELVDNPANDFVEDFLGQHRFQLTLLTRHAVELAEDRGSADLEGAPVLRHRASMADALDVFKGTDRDRLPVNDAQGQARQMLRRERLLEAITEAFGVGSEAEARERAAARGSEASAANGQGSDAPGAEG